MINTYILSKRKKIDPTNVPVMNWIMISYYYKGRNLLGIAATERTKNNIIDVYNSIIFWLFCLSYFIAWKREKCDLFDVQQLH